MFKHIVDDHIELRMMEYSDTNSLYHLIEKNRDYLREWLGWVDRNNSFSDTADFIKFTKNSYANGYGVKVGIWYKNNLVGLIDHHEVNRNAKSCQIGYWLDADHQGKGIITKSCIAMIKYAFKLGMNKVEIRCAEKNFKSRRIPEKLGFTEEGKLRAAEFLIDHYVDHVVYGLLKKEWENF